MSEGGDPVGLQAHDPAAPKPARQPARRRRSWPRRIAVWSVEALGGLIGLVLLLLVILAARLQLGPIEVDALTPVLTSVIDDRLGPLTSEIKGVTIDWRLGHAAVEVAGTDLAIRDSTGRVVLALPKLTISVDLRSLVRRQPLIKRINLVGPTLHVIRNRAGDLGLDVSSDEPEPTSEPETVSLFDAIDQLATGRGPFAVLGRLEEVGIVGATARFDDESTGISARLVDGKAVLHPEPGGLAIDFEAGLRLGEAHAGVSGKLAYAAATQRLNLNVALGAINPASLTPSLGAVLPILAKFDLPIAGRFDAELSPERIEHAGIELSADSGVLLDPALVDGRLAIKRAGGRLGFDGVAGRLDLDRVAIELGGPVLELRGTLDNVDPGRLLAGSSGVLDGRIGATLRDVPISDLAAVWPPQVAPHAREWVTSHLSVGTIPEAEAEAAVKIDPAANALSVVVGQSGGHLALRNATLEFLPGLPPAENIDAMMDFTPERLNFGITGGRLLGVIIPVGSVVIDQLGAAFERLTLDLEIDGPIGDVLQVLDAKRLGYATAVGIDPKSARGLIAGKLHFRFPLKNDLPFAEVDYGAHAVITELGLPKVAFGQSLEHGAFALALDPKSLTLDGLGRIGQVPVALHARQRLAGTGPSLQVRAQARLDDAQRHRFGLDILPDEITGPISADALYVIGTPGRARARIALDLGDATLSIPEAGWQKPAGVPAHAGFGLTLVDDHVTELDGLTARGQDLDIAGALSFEAGRLSHATFGSLHLGKTEGAFEIDHPAASPWHLAFTGKSLDLGTYFQTLKTPATGAGPGPDLQIDLSADSLALGPGRVVDRTRFSGRITDRRVMAVDLAAQIGQGRKLTLQLAPPEKGAGIHLETEDFGETLRLFDVTGNVRGGRVTLTGKALPQAQGGRLFTGTIDGKDYRVSKASFLARLLSSASLTSIASLLQGEGIPFDDLKGAVCLKDGRLTIAGVEARGAVGINASGTYGIDADELDLSGTLVPAPMLNSILGNVPLVGDFINGGPGGGLFVFSFTVTGKSGDPSVQVNPATAVVPGFVRGLFSGDAPGCAEPRPR